MYGTLLTPLSLIPDAHHPHHPHQPFAQHLAALPSGPQPLTTLTPLAPGLPPLTPLSPTRRTRLMAILNLTPDSFSDGGEHDPADPAALAAAARACAAAGATLVDLGGQSTRPRAEYLGPDEETARVLPAVRAASAALRETTAAAAAAMAAPDGPAATAVSIDTFHAPVARAALGAGAALVNDVSAGALDGDLLPAVAAAGCTVVLGHLRGTPQTMARHTDYPADANYPADAAGGGGVVGAVAAELRARLAAAEAAGVARWRVVLDPGLGFAKTAAQSAALLRGLGALRAAPGLRGLPWLVGPSRKGFVGAATGVRVARERGWGTAAAVAAAVQGGADVVRVHDVREMRDVVSMADAIWRA